MKRNETDKVIQDKLRSLDALAGGVVFGKEEAWERLQGRLEHKPVKRMPLVYRMAAAAVLLVMVCVGGFFYHPVKEVEIAAHSTKQVAPASNSVSSRAATLPVTNDEEVIPVGKRNVIAIKTGKQEQTAEIKMNAANGPDKAATPLPLVAESNANSDAVEISVPVASAPVKMPVNKAMSVVYIDDIEPAGTDRVPGKDAAAYNHGQTDLKRMQVYHINDIEREQVQLKAILNDNRNTFVHHLFHGSDYPAVPATNEEFAPPNGFLRNLLNTNN